MKYIVHQTICDSGDIVLKVPTLEQWQLLKTLSLGGCEIDWTDFTEPLSITLGRHELGAELLLTPRRLILCMRVNIVAHIPAVITGWGLEADWIESLEWISLCSMHSGRYCVHDWRDCGITISPGAFDRRKRLKLQEDTYASGILLATVNARHQSEHAREVSFFVNDIMRNKFSKRFELSFRNCTEETGFPGGPVS